MNKYSLKTDINQVYSECLKIILHSKILIRMYIEQLYTGCLAQACYYVESNGEAIIIDPLRDIQPYLNLLETRGTKLLYVIETHFHADFVGGHIDLAKETGATILFGPGATPAYPAYIASHHEKLVLGDLVFEILHTPGHTQESICVLLYDQHKPYCIFTGDTLFIGDVGRPDLVQKVKSDITPEFLAGALFDSLHQSILPLPNEVIIYPGHGAGSACGKHMSKETQDTLGNQKKLNYALKPELSRTQFIALVTKGLTEPPAYFPENVLLNIKGSAKDIHTVLKEGNHAMSPFEVRTYCSSNPSTLVLDTRSKEQFCDSHIPGSLFIGLDDNFAPWAGTLIPDLNTPLILVCDYGREVEAIARLSRVGYDNCIGFLQGGLNEWILAGETYSKINCVDPSEYVQYISDKPHQLLDVRRHNEYEQAHIEHALNIPLDYLQKQLNKLHQLDTYYVHCAGGYRSVIACSILLAKGFPYVVNITGGFNQLKEQPLPLVKHEVEVIDI